jgi:hypothetical protein
MITIEKYQIFEQYSGDSDGFARLASKTEKELFDSEDWVLIDSFIQDIELINKGLVSSDYKEKILDKLKSEADLATFNILTKDLI